MSRRLRARADDGATTVEFALVVPLFIVLVGIGAYFAWMYFMQSQLQRGANQAARVIAVQKTDGTYDFCLASAVKNINADIVGDAVSSSDVVLVDGANNRIDSTSKDQCLTTPSGSIQVRVTHQFTNPFTDILGFFTGAQAGFTVNATGQARVEQQ